MGKAKQAQMETLEKSANEGEKKKLAIQEKKQKDEEAAALATEERDIQLRELKARFGADESLIRSRFIADVQVLA